MKNNKNIIYHYYIISFKIVKNIGKIIKLVLSVISRLIQNSNSQIGSLNDIVLFYIDIMQLLSYKVHGGNCGIF